MQKKQVMTLLLATAMLLSTATGCDREAITKAVFDNLESALLTGSDTETDESQIEADPAAPATDPVTDPIDGSTDEAGEEQAKAEPVRSRRTNVYSSQTIALPNDIREGETYVQHMVNIGDTIYMLYDNPTGSQIEDTQTWLYGTDVAGENTTFVSLPDPFGGDGSILKMLAGEGKLYLLYQTWYDGYGYWLLEIDPTDGSVQNEYDLTKAKDALDLGENDSYYILDAALSGHTAYIGCGKAIVSLDLQSETYSSIIELQDDTQWIDSVYATDDGVFYVTTDYNQWTFFALDPATGTSTELAIEGLRYYNPIGTYDGKIYFNSYDRIVAYDTQTGETSVAIDFLGCDIHLNEVSRIVLTTDGTMVYATDHGSVPDADTNSLYWLEWIPDEQMPEEVQLTIASASYSKDLLDHVVRYNRQNDGVHLNIRCYSVYDTPENDYTGAAAKIHEDILSGNGLDIVLLDNNMPIESCCSKELFADLYPFLDDEENGIDRSQYFENVFKACEQDGKLYSLLLRFSVETLSAKPAYVGDESGWTMAQMLDAIDAMPAGMRAFSDYGRDALLEKFLVCCSDLFIDWETGTTHFAAGDTIRFLEFLKSCPEISVLDAYYASSDFADSEYSDMIKFQNDYKMRYYKDTALLSSNLLYELYTYKSVYEDFAGDVTTIGYPTDDGGNGAVLWPDLELAICAASEHQELAWDFLRDWLTNEEYDLFEEMEFSTTKKYMDEMIDQAETYYPNRYTASIIDYIDTEAPENQEYAAFLREVEQAYTKEMGQKVCELIQGATTVMRMDSEILAIVREELIPFYDGSITAAEVAQAIDSRVTAYINGNG